MAKQVLSPEPAGSPGASGPGATSPTPGHPSTTPTAGVTASQPPLVPGMTASKREKPLGPDYDQAEPNFTKIEQTEIAKAISDLEGGSAASDVIKVNIFYINPNRILYWFNIFIPSFSHLFLGMLIEFFKLIYRY